MPFIGVLYVQAHERHTHAHAVHAFFNLQAETNTLSTLVCTLLTMNNSNSVHIYAFAIINGIQIISLTALICISFSKYPC